MTNFDNKEKAFENKFAYDEEKKFKITARAYKLLALWAAKMMNRTEDEANQYADSIINQLLQDLSGKQIIKSIFEDCKNSGITITEHQISNEFANFSKIAAEQLA